MSAPRIDTFERTIDAVIARLEELRPEVWDVHDLAYNRSRAANEQKVNGGERDYALDTHGDMRARDLYIDVAAELIGLARGAEKALKKLRGHMNRQSTALRRDGSANVTASEFDQARYARERRLARGEHHPHVVVAQPTRKHHIDPVGELEQLQGALRRIVQAANREHTDCRSESGKRKPRWLDRSVLSPAQRAAVDRALIGDQGRASA